MTCQNHAETPATAYCRTCGKPVCDQCRRDAYGTIYCEEHVPQTAAAPPPPFAAPSAYAPAPGPPVYARTDVSPALAFFLGLIPGVGAIYNGQYAKGLVHAIVWGVLISILSSGHPDDMEPLFGMLLVAWWAYMAIEAHHTAQRLQRGEAVDEYSSLLNLRGGRVPVAAIGLIVLGVLLLLHTLDLINFEFVSRFWPVLLIAAGAYLLWERLSKRNEEVRHER